MNSREPSNSTDRELIQAGFRYAMSLTHDRHDAEDLVQQACLKVLRAKGSLVGQRYLFVAIRHLFFDQRRLAALRPGSETEEDQIPDESRSHVLEVEQRLDTEELLGSLRPEEREALFLNCVEGYTAEEIGRLTDQPRNTVLSHLARAKRRLQQRYRSADVMESR